MVNELAQGPKAGERQGALLASQGGRHQCPFEAQLRRFLETERAMGDRPHFARQRDQQLNGVESG